MFATPANRLFPLYLAMLALTAWSAGALLRQADAPALGALFSPRAPVRGIAAYMWAVTGLNAAAWLSRIIPALSAAGATAYLRGTGPATNIVYIQDLPAVAAAAGRRRGLALAAPATRLSACGCRPGPVDPGEPEHRGGPLVRPRRRPGFPGVASAALVPAFAALALIGLIPAALLLHGLAGGVPGRTAPRWTAAPGRGWAAWALGTVAVLTGAAAVFGMPLSWLSHTPVHGWALPGAALLAGVALPQLTLTVLVAVGERRALAAGYLAGVALMAWIAIQLPVLQRYFFLQPVIAGVGTAELLLTWAWQRVTVSRPGRKP